MKDESSFEDLSISASCLKKGKTIGMQGLGVVPCPTQISEGLLPAKPWLRSLGASTTANTNLVCFPFSGGSAQVFAPWNAKLSKDVGLWGVQYPGRGDRYAEAFACSVRDIGVAVAEEMSTLGLGDIVLLGHSLGGIVAYEAAVRLSTLGLAPRMLVVSSCSPPGVMLHRTLHSAPDEEFWATLAGLGGIDTQIVESPELRDVLAPILRSDLGLHARYQPDVALPQLQCPVLCYQASADPVVDVESLDDWAEVTTGSFELRRVEGDHFHAFDDASQLVSTIVGELKNKLQDWRI
ncbi:thioesterase II family protein [Actinomyces sp. Marseille-P3109]|uniref:thioesterase II family protein n=1 Tax=Actinomyces sp. Marseille-P3109 TaxID=2083009 RepID=UPI000D54D389|nr:alpha/beta fold hydrolase [Actinomyces sp. Marseille-P3109]